MTVTKTFLSLLLLAAALFAVPAQAVININSDEIWDGVNNPHPGAVTLNGGVYTINDSVVIGPGANVFLRDPFSANFSDSITWEFAPGAGGLTFADANSTIDTYVGDRNLPLRTFTLNMNDNPIGVSVPGAGRIINGIFVLADLSGDGMTVNINSLTDVVLGTIDERRSDARGTTINITTQGTVDIDYLSNSDTSAGGGSTLPVNITGESLILGDIDTRNFRADGNGGNGHINLRALGQPEDSVGDFNANSAAANTITLDGLINTNGPPLLNPRGTVTVTGVKVTLASTFMADISETAEFNVTVGTTGNGFVEGDLFVNNSAATPDSVNYTVFHDGVGPADIEWDNNNSGNWHDIGNWTPASIPSANNQTAIFGSALNSQQTIFMDQPALVRGVRFDSPQVALTGTTSLTLESNSGNASLAALQGSHDVDVQVTLNNNTDASAAAGSEINLNSVLNLNGNTLNVSGAGQVNINSTATGMGSVVNSGTLGTEGLTGISGDLSSTGILDFDLGGKALGLFDAFAVTGTATLSGQISVETILGFSPQVGDTFTILTAGTLDATGLSLTGPDASQFSLSIDANSLVLQAMGGGVLSGDFDGNGSVGNNDLTLLLDNWGAAVPPDPTGWIGDLPTAPGIGNDELTRLLDSWGSSALLSTAAIPEPGSLLLLSVAMLTLVGSGRSSNQSR